MKRIYEEPSFDLEKFSFSEILADYMEDSTPEETRNETGSDNEVIDPFGG